MLNALHEWMKERNDARTAALLVEFSNAYYRNISANEWLARSVEDVYGATLSIWQLLQQRSAGVTNIRVFNPDYENHGWQSSHTIIELITDDKPFLVDSVRMELNQRQMAIHAIHYAVVPVERDKKGALVASRDGVNSPESAPSDALLSIEIDHHSDVATLLDLSQTLQDIVREVSVCVADFNPMLARMDEHIDALQSTPELAEQRAFLVWLRDQHFTFLAYDEFVLNKQKGALWIERTQEADLGLFRGYPKQTHRLKLNTLPADIQQFIGNDQSISFMKSGQRCRVHRPAYPDYVVIKRFNSAGDVIGGVRFMGMFTSIVYLETPNNIPIIRDKLQRVRELSGFERNSYRAKELDRILEVYPRDELFQSTAEQLQHIANSILNIQERRQTRVYLRKDPYSKFLSCLLYTPRDIYNTELRQKIEQVLMQEFAPLHIEFNTYFSESILARTHFILRLDEQHPVAFDEAQVAHKIQQAVRSWQDDLHAALIEQVGEETGNDYYQRYRHAFPAGYRERFTARGGVSDIVNIEALLVAEPNELGMSFYRELEEDEQHFRFKLFQRDGLLPLSDVIPVLENLGLRVMGEHPYELRLTNARCESVWVHDFTLYHASAEPINLAAIKTLFQHAFAAIWHGCAENDSFNRLVLSAQMNWRQVALLRAYARYMKQIKFGISERYIADTLCRYVSVSQQLLRLFELRFGLHDQSLDDRQTHELQHEAHLIAALEQVQQLNEDRTIRRYMELIKATLRTNFYQHDELGQDKSYISLKLNPSAVSDMPLPRPMFEIFVYSPRTEGVHLRAGKVARGGLRWSDRTDDFRTEVLGLVKAQQVKNAIIVPVGAKGGFIVKCPPTDGGREAQLAEGIACYQTFIRALLDVTDNRVDGAIVPPLQVVRHDEDDAYLVVAADKGTASFSDIANEISLARGFWMKDAFASGGSVGYDHKKMGITARGAWVSVQRHFRERGMNVQEQPFTVVGIGDMSGDVFGNGMLLSPHIQLQAAFNHQHIFIDPAPDVVRSFAERARLFQLPRSSWTDYDVGCISAGGGVFARSAKSIALTPEIRRCLAIEDERLTPNELIKAIMRAPVDLLWNGGIGTYVKSHAERHSLVGDKANDGLRVNGDELRAQVVGEGGNLGFTQLGRIEYALNGGVSYTDSIDNAGGVNCSDHEVNIKIMLNELLGNGDLTLKQRNDVFVKLTDDVADLVLEDNYRQTQAIVLAYRDCAKRLDDYQRVIQALEQSGKLNRSLEGLPSDDELLQRKQSGLGLTRPELSVLISYIKAELKEQLNDDVIANDDDCAQLLFGAFPSALATDFAQPLAQHRLRRDIIATQLANDMVNYMGITFVHRLHQSTGASSCDIARAYLTAKGIFSLDDYWQQLMALDTHVDSAVQERMMSDMIRLVRRATRWLLRNRRNLISIEHEVNAFQPSVQSLVTVLSSTLQGESLLRWQSLTEERQQQGVPALLASVTSAATDLYAALGIIEVAQHAQRSLDEVSLVYFTLGEKLSLSWFMEQITALNSQNHWQALARESLRDDLDWQQRALAMSLLTSYWLQGDLPEALLQWQQDQQLLFDRWQTMLIEIRKTEHMEFAMAAVALRELLDLAQASRH